MHWNEPCTLVHVAIGGQGLDRHSSTSETEERKRGKMVIVEL